ncbi:MAG: SRPBCC family protein [Actinomycetota bacterium]
MEYTSVETRLAHCSPQAVLERLLDPATWPAWQPEIMIATGPSRLAVGDVARGRARLLGFEVDGHSTAVDVGTGSFEEDVVVGVRMRIRYELTPGPHGTVIAHRLTAELPRGVAGRVLSWFLRRRLRGMQRKALERLAAQAEST